MNNIAKEKTPLTVLVIEDHPDQRDLLAIVLQREGYRVVTAANGVEALEKLEVEKVQIALSDIMMPKMDGYKVCGMLKRDTRYSRIPLIIFSACAQESDVNMGKECGANAYVTKPFKAEELLARIRELLNQHP